MRTAAIRTFFMVSALMIAASTAHAGAEQALHYSLAQSSLTGLLGLEEHFASPNYGENPDFDTLEAVYILSLDEPITVIGKVGDELNSTTFEGVKRVQLVLDRRTKPSEFIGC
jgi:hypothetical protein